MKFARVHFRRDDVWKNVPVSFIVDLDPENVKPHRAYRVFDSNIPGDTPELANKRFAKIPVVEDTEESMEAAYYRATVAMVKDSEEELQQALSMCTGKRMKEVPRKLLTSSFDEKNTLCMSQHTGKKRKSVRNISSEQQSKKLKRDTGTLDSASKSCTSVKESTKKNAEAAGGSKVKAPDALLELQTRGAEKTRASLRNLVKSNPKNCSVSQDKIAKTAKSYIMKRFHVKTTETTDGTSEVSDSDGSGESDSSDRDPSMPSPRKMKGLECDLKLSKNALNRYISLNATLQEKLLGVETKYEELQQAHTELQEKYKVLKAEMDAVGSRREVYSVSHKESHAKNITPTSSSSTLAVSFEQDMCYRGEAQETRSAAVSDARDESTVSSIHSAEGHEVTWKETATPDSGEEKACEEKRSDATVTAQRDVYEIHPGYEMPAKDWDNLLRERNGEKGDSQFVKSLLLKIFTLQELLTSTVMGRLNPKALVKAKNGGAELPSKKPALKEAKLQSLQRCLIEKVRRETEGLANQSEEIQRRTLFSKVKKIIRDRLKTLRADSQMCSPPRDVL